MVAIVAIVAMVAMVCPLHASSLEDII